MGSLAQVRAEHLGGEQRMQRIHDDGHGAHLSAWAFRAGRDQFFRFAKRCHHAAPSWSTHDRTRPDRQPPPPQAPLHRHREGGAGSSRPAWSASPSRATSSPEFGWNGPAAHIKLIFGDASQEPRAARHAPTRRGVSTRRLASWTWISSCTAKALRRRGPRRPPSASSSRSPARAATTPSIPVRSGSCLPATTPRFRRSRRSSRPCLLRLRYTPSSKLSTIRNSTTCTSGPNVTIEWLHRGPDVASAGRPLEAAIRAVTLAARIGPRLCRVRIGRDAPHPPPSPQRTQARSIAARDPGLLASGRDRSPDRDYGEDA